MRVQARKKNRKQIYAGNQTFQEVDEQTKGTRKRKRPESAAGAEADTPEDTVEPASEADEAVEVITSCIAGVQPADHLLAAECPPLDKQLVGQLIAIKWDVGWQLGTVQRKLGVKRKKRKVGFVDGANYDVVMASERGPREVQLSEDKYCVRDGAPPGSWAFFVPLNCAPSIEEVFHGKLRRPSFSRG